MNPQLMLKNSRKANRKERIIDKKGYVLIYTPFNPFNKSGYCMEHKLVVEAKINRMLIQGETIHHINHIKSDNRIENLYLFKSQKEHKSFENKVKQFGFTQPILKQIENRWKEYE